MSTKPVVVVAMSGGVDSSVTAALLVEQGHKVIGMMLRLWNEQDAERSNRCCTPDSMTMARKVAAILSIPFYVLDARQYFYDAVVKPFIDDYTHNLTPNPCINCNRSVRWDFLLNHALASGADYLATGHYARLEEQPDHSIQLLRGVDAAKDQSYVLHVLSQDKLKHALFPLGGYKKPEVRQLARKYNLPVAEKKDSQDLCFVGGDGDYRQFLTRHMPESIFPGEIQDQQRNIIGSHKGLAFYTIGQRKGLQLSSPTPLYVIEKDAATNRLVVGPHNRSSKSELKAENVNWIAGPPPDTPFSASVKIRYKAQDVQCTVEQALGDMLQVKFKNPVWDITPGQAAVLYNGEVCLGGGIITNNLEK